MSYAKPIVIGIYGVPGCGKSHLMNGPLKQALGEEKYAYYDGSDVIDAVYDGGLAAFKLLEQSEKYLVREEAIKHIANECARSSKVGIVTGHLSFWTSGQPDPVFTKADFDTYSGILYLDVSPEHVLEQRHQDIRVRSDRSLGDIESIAEHQDYERKEIRRLCYEHGVLIARLFRDTPNTPDMVSTAAKVVQHIASLPTEEQNETRVIAHLDQIMSLQQDKSRLKTMLVIDGDKTLAPNDTGSGFWLGTPQGRDTLKSLFSSKMKYSYRAFLQAAMLYETEVSEAFFDGLCATETIKIEITRQMRDLLRRVVCYKDTGAIIVTCGLRPVWEAAIELCGLEQHLKVIGGDRIDNGYVVTGATKAAIVKHLQIAYHTKVWAIGDSLLDLDMLRQADNGVVIVGKPAWRSKSMSEHLITPEGRKGLEGKVFQVSLPPDAPALTAESGLALPQTDLLTLFPERWHLNFTHATGKSVAKLLMAPMRDAHISGRRLQEAHGRVGFYLASEYLADVLGLEEFEMAHVQGCKTQGHRLGHEAKTIVIALMRGGEAMAFGVHDAFPLASFLHASKPEDIKLEHVQDSKNVILVDSVINSGKSIVEHVKRVFDLRVGSARGPGRIAVVAGVVQAESMKEDGGLMRGLQGYGYGSLDVVALRKSENAYTGKGGTDTGNRLFNTTHLE